MLPACVIGLVVLSQGLFGAVDGVDDLLLMLETKSREREARLGGVEFAYTVTVRRPPREAQPQGSTETFHQVLTRAGESWRIDSSNVHMQGGSEDRYDGKSIESSTLNRHQLYLEYTGGASARRAQEGHLWKPEAAPAKLSYLTFYNAFQGRPVSSYLRDIEQDITSVEVSEDGIHVAANVGASGKGRFTFDAATSDLLRIELEDADEGSREETTIVHARTGAGITMPVAGSKRLYLIENGRETLIREIELGPIEPAGIATGREFPSGHFDFEFPDGTRVVDNIAGVTYVSGTFSRDSPVVVNLARTLAMVKKEDYEAVGRVYEAVQAGAASGAPVIPGSAAPPSGRVGVIAGGCCLAAVLAAMGAAIGLKRRSRSGSSANGVRPCRRAP